MSPDSFRHSSQIPKPPARHAGMLHHQPLPPAGHTPNPTTFSRLIPATGTGWLVSKPGNPISMVTPLLLILRSCSSDRTLSQQIPEPGQQEARAPLKRVIHKLVSPALHATSSQAPRGHSAGLPVFVPYPFFTGILPIVAPQALPQRAGKEECRFFCQIHSFS